jgi:hypothetical protein
MTDTQHIRDQILVKSHVPRDLLQNAALFKTDRLVVWEYVANGLQYVDEGINPEVRVTLDSKKKCIFVEDNGRGMDWAGLQNFFVMHGENIDRMKGRPGRGYFGTGKSAAFGIADVLRVTTIRNGKRSKVELRRSDIDRMSTEDPIPVQTIEREVATTQSNGTLVEIAGIHLKSLDQSAIIQFIERNLAGWRNAIVYVNNHECEYTEPPLADKKIFKPEAKQREKLGNAELIIKIARAPIQDKELRGISIWSNNVLHETTLVGNEGKEMSQYIFGEIDVPALDEDKSPIPPFDLSRSLRLNPSNEIVQAIFSFIGPKIDQVRRELLKAEKERRASEDAKELAKQAEAIAQVINDDFTEFRHRVALAKAKGGKGFDPYDKKQEGGEEEEDLIFGTQLEVDIISQEGGLGSEGGRRTGGEKPRALGPQVTPPTSKDAPRKGQPAGGSGDRSSSRGGFRVEFKPMGAEVERARYIREDRTIYVNIDHPQLVAAKGTGSIEDPIFQRLVYEIVFSEYAIALAYELYARGDYIDTSDAIYDIRETINRLARRAASLYSA